MRALLLALLLVVVLAAGAALPALEAGTAVRDITPPADHPFMHDRDKVEGIHDPLSVRALALREGKTTVVVAVADVIGIERPLVQEIRRLANLPRIPPEHIIIAATHNHSGPDVIGMWNGVPADYLERFKQQVAAAIREAVADLHPARMAAANYHLPPRLVLNWRDPYALDLRATALILRGKDGATIATLTNFACHAEVLNTHQPVLSADWPGEFNRNMEQTFGGTSLFFNGPLGGMVSPDVDDDKTTFADVARFGKRAAEAAATALRGAKPVGGSLAVKTLPVQIKVENERFLGLGQKIERPDMASGSIQTEISEVRYGPVQFVTMPAEFLPRVGMLLADMMTGTYRLRLGLANDELGYILPTGDWRQGEYVESVSPGPGVAATFLAAYRELLQPKEPEHGQP